jgi:uncharacterized protein with NAD-binding domain and iron-sulfur cluster
MLERPERIVERYPLVQDPPFSLDGVAAYLFAVRCSGDALARLVARTFGWAAADPTSPVSVRPVGDVCLFVFTHTAKASAADPTRGSFSYRELAVFVPVIVEQQGRPARLAMHLPFIYPDQGLAVAAGREIYGMPKKPATIAFPDDPSAFFAGAESLTVDVLGARRFDGAPWTTERLVTAGASSGGEAGLVAAGVSELHRVVDALVTAASADLSAVHLLEQDIVQLKQVPDVSTGGLPPRVLYRAVTRVEAPLKTLSNVVLADASRVQITLGDVASDPLRDVLELPATVAPLVAASVEMTFGFDDGEVLVEQPDQGRVPEKKTRVLVLGGGMGALATAHALTDTEARRRRFDVHVLAQGHTLGGKGASHRDPDPVMGARNLEHGLHVFFGFYHNALRFMRSVYVEAGRGASSQPSTFDAAFQPTWGLTLHDGVHSYELTLPKADADRGVTRREVSDKLEVVKDLIAGILGLKWPDILKPSSLAHLLALLVNPVGRDVVFFAITLVLGIGKDIVEDSLTFDDLDRYDFREWIARHHVLGFPDLSKSAIMQVPYDGVFAYPGPDTASPRLGAGLAARGLLALVADYELAPMFIMQAGMGECVFAPLYEVLKKRGVRFEQFAKVDEVRLEGGRVTTVRYARQAAVTAGPFAYDPTANAGDIVSWSANPDPAQLAPGSPIIGQDPYSDAVDVHVGADPELVVDRDFDVVVCALPAPVTAQVLRGHESNPALAKIARIPTVATLHTQLWFNGTTSSLGWTWPSLVLGGFREPLASMHLRDRQLVVEQWPSVDPPRGLLYLSGPFCAGYTTDSSDPAARAAATAAAMNAAVDFATRELPKALPGFDAAALYRPGGQVPARLLDLQYVRNNIDLSQRYCLCLPGGLQDRPAPATPGLTNLVFAGDWTKNGVDIPCIEGTVVSALLAAERITGEDLDILG